MNTVNDIETPKLEEVTVSTVILKYGKKEVICRSPMTDPSKMEENCYYYYIY